MKNIFKLGSVFMAIALVISSLLMTGVLVSAAPDWQLVYDGAFSDTIEFDGEYKAEIPADGFAVAWANEIATNGVSSKYKFVSDISFVSEGYACWGGWNVNNSAGQQWWGADVNAAQTTEFNASAVTGGGSSLTADSADWVLGVVGEGSGTLSATEFKLYAYREGGAAPTGTEAQTSATEAAATETQAAPSESQVAPGGDQVVASWNGVAGYSYLYNGKATVEVYGYTAQAGGTWTTFASNLGNLAADNYVKIAISGAFEGAGDSTAQFSSRSWNETSSKIDADSFDETGATFTIAGPLTYKATDPNLGFSMGAAMTSIPAAGDIAISVTVYKKAATEAESTATEAASTATEAPATETQAPATETQAPATETQAAPTETQAAPAATNLIKNGDFSNGTTDWSVTPSSGYIDNFNATTGQLVVVSAHSTASTLKASFTEAIKPSTAYTLHVDVIASNDVTVEIKYDTNHSDTITATGNYTFVTYNEVSNFAIQVSVPKNMKNTATGTFDNFILVEGTSIPTSTEAQSTATETATEAPTSATEAPTEASTEASQSATEAPTEASQSATVTETETEAAPTETEVPKNYELINTWNGVAGYTYFYQGKVNAEVYKGSGLPGGKTWGEFAEALGNVTDDMYLEIIFNGEFPGANDSEAIFNKSRTWTETTSSIPATSFSETSVSAKLYGPLTFAGGDSNLAFEMKSAMTAAPAAADIQVIVNVYKEATEPTGTEASQTESQASQTESQASETQAQPTGAGAVIATWSDTNGMDEREFNEGAHTSYMYLRKSVAGTTGTWGEFSATLGSLTADQYLEIVYTGTFTGATADYTTLTSHIWSETESKTFAKVVSANDTQVVVRIEGPTTFANSTSPNLTLGMKNLTALSEKTDTHVTVNLYDRSVQPTDTEASETATEAPTETETAAPTAPAVAIDSWSDDSGISGVYYNDTTVYVYLYNGCSGTGGTWGEFVSNYTDLTDSQYVEIVVTGSLPGLDASTASAKSRVWKETTSSIEAVEKGEDMAKIIFKGPLTSNGTLDPNIDFSFKGGMTGVGEKEDMHVTVTIYDYNAPQPTETEPAPTESTPSETGSEPSSTESTPSATESTPSATESTPSATESTPSESVVDPTATGDVVIPGDIDNDGDINMKDVLAIRKYLAGMESEINAAAADLNGDGAINMKDVLILRKFLAGMYTDVLKAISPNALAMLIKAKPELQAIIAQAM